MLRVTPVYGSRFDPKGAARPPTCTLVEYGDVSVLWNVGSWWGRDDDDPTEKADENDKIMQIDDGDDNNNNMKKKMEFPDLPEHDCVIITDSTLNGLGGLPLYCKKYPEVPIYTTFPTVKMGQMNLYDEHASLCLDGARPPYTMQQMDDAFSRLRTIKYSQAITVHSRLTKVPSLSITAYRAGHVVGGAFYVLQRLQDETQVVLTSTYHIAKELHVDSSTLLKYGATPDVLVTYPGGPAMKYLAKLYPNTGTLTTTKQQQQQQQNQQKKKKETLKSLTPSQAQRALVETILSVLRRDGHVLLPVDASGRVLELIYLLSQHWDRHRLAAAYNLCWLGPMVFNTLDFCRSQLEWMAGPLGAQFDTSSGPHPYALNNVHLCASTQQLENILKSNNNPSCVVASGCTLDHGPARDLLLKWADNDNNAIIFTDSSQCVLRTSRRLHHPHRQRLPNDRQREQEKQQQQQQQQKQKQGRRRSSASTQSNVKDGNQQQKKQQQQQQQQQQKEHDVRDATAAATEEVDASGEGEENTAFKIGAPIPNDAKISEFSAAGQLLKQWAEAKLSGEEMEDSIWIDVLVPHRAPLAGKDLKVFLEKEEAQRQKQKQEEEKRAMLREVELAKGRLRLGEETTETTTAAATTAAPSSATENSASTLAATTTSSVATKRPKKKSRFDSTLFLKFSKPLHLTFEVREEAVGVGQNDSTAKYGIGESVGRSGEILEDDYGIAVIPERFTDIVSGVDPSKFSGKVGEEVLRRGFGFGVDMSSKKQSQSSAHGGTGGRKVDGTDDVGELEEEVDEQALEASDLSEGNGIIRGRNGRPPTKVMTIPRKLEVLAEIAYVPLEGRVDARAARQSVRALQPRQVVVLGGPVKRSNDKDGNGDDDVKMIDEVTLLAEAAQSFATGKKIVHTPSDGETVTLSVGHAAYSVRLIDTPFESREDREKRLKEEAKALEEGNDPPPAPEPVEILETKVGACTVALLDCVATGQKVAADGSIVLAPRPIPPKFSWKNQPSIYLSDGEVLLTDLRSELIAQGMKAEYSAHPGYSQLIVNGKIVIKKPQDSSGKINVEGPLCEDFYTVRSVVAGQYVTL